VTASTPTAAGNPKAASKPVDVGNGRLAASFAANAPALLSLLLYQPDHGVAELSAMPPFDEARRGQPDYVRDYRRLMTSDRFACLELETSDGQRATAERIDLSDPERPTWHGHIGAATFAAYAFSDAHAIVVNWHVTEADRAATDRPPAAQPQPALRLRFAGLLDRPTLAEITELDAPLPTGSVTTLKVDGSRLHVEASLPARLTLDAGEGEWRTDGASAWLDLPPRPGRTRTVTVRCTATDNPNAGAAPSRRPDDLPLAGPAARMVARALAYVRGCTALRTAPDEVAILTDHRILPLSWTRDAYYQAVLLLATGQPQDDQLVADHLRWLWRRCERPEGRWLRSHHANGVPKDLAFQADQQLYPMLELADYWRGHGQLPAGVDWRAEVPRAWAAAITELDPATGLIATAENAADDPAPAPFIGASQVLLWCAALRLAELADAQPLDLDGDELRAVARAARTGFDRHLVRDDVWLYASDAAATHVRYHDANDLPVALAPLLGFCAADDAGWQQTMAFAFSPANPGYFAGERGGLGSAHTPNPWTLGEIQAWLWARSVGDETAMAAAIDRLAGVSFDDGMLPEAYSATCEPDVRIRHWFAWPGAALGALLLLDARGELGQLRVARQPGVAEA
jgi:hypothetical protein